MCVKAIAHSMDINWEAAWLYVSMSYMFKGRCCSDDSVICSKSDAISHVDGIKVRGQFVYDIENPSSKTHQHSILHAVPDCHDQRMHL